MKFTKFFNSMKKLKDLRRASENIGDLSKLRKFWGDFISHKVIQIYFHKSINPLTN